MAIEQGIVVKLGAEGIGTAWVKTIRSSACESCASRESCNPGGGGQSQEVEALNPAGAHVGDRIQLSIATGAMLKATFLLYLFPIICMMAGGIIGNWMAPQFQMDPSSAAVIAALAGFGASLLIVRAGGRHMGRKEAYRPKIIRIIGHEPQHVTISEPPITCSHQNRS